MINVQINIRNVSVAGKLMRHILKNDNQLLKPVHRDEGDNDRNVGFILPDL